MITGHDSPVALKAACNRAHAFRRATERYPDIGITRATIRNFESRIRLGSSPDCVIISPDHRGKERHLWALRHEDAWLPVVFDVATDSVMTVLPPRALDRYMAVLSPVPASQASCPKIDPDRRPGRIVGFRRSPDTPTIDLPPLPPEPDRDDSPDKLDEFLTAVKSRTFANEIALIGMDKDDPSRRFHVAEKTRLAGIGRRAKKIRHEMFTDIDTRRKIQIATAVGIDPSGDPEVLIRLAVKAISSMVKRIGRDELSPFEAGVVSALQARLHDREPGNKSTDGTETESCP